jgi:hypothetical protein
VVPDAVREVPVVAEGFAWRTAEEVPGTSALNKGKDAQITSVSCGSAGHCSPVSCTSAGHCRPSGYSADGYG